MLQVIHAPFDVSDAERRKQTDGEIPQSRHVAWAMQCTNCRPVFAEGKILSVVKLVLDTPVAAFQFSKAFGIQIGKVDVGNQIYILGAFLAGFNYLPFPMKQGDLLHIGKFHPSVRCCEN